MVGVWKWTLLAQNANEMGLQKEIYFFFNKLTGRGDADIEAEAGARLTCHLLLRLFKTVECPQPALYSVGQCSEQLICITVSLWEEVEVWLHSAESILMFLRSLIQLVKIKISGARFYSVCNSKPESFPQHVCLFEIRWGEWILSVHLILSATLGPGVYSASNRNEYQKQKKINVSGQ
jgi:hypothetical protein